jgi:TonB family protein
MPPNKEAMTIPAPAIKSDSVKPATADVSKPPNSLPPTKPDTKTFKDKAAALASPGSGFFGTEEGFPLGEYAAQIKPIIEGHFEIPNYLAHAKGRTTVVFYINAKGMYENATIATGSGNVSLDFAALAAIRNSAPFPWPKGYPGNRIGVKYVFVYNQ